MSECKCYRNGRCLSSRRMDEIDCAGDETRCKYRWVKNGAMDYTCPYCGDNFLVPYKFCPECGKRVQL